MYRPYLYRDPMGSTVAAIEGVTNSQEHCEMRRSRLLASEARSGLPKRTLQLTTSAMPFLLLS